MRTTGLPPTTPAKDWTTRVRSVGELSTWAFTAFPYEWNEDFISRAGGVGAARRTNRFREAERVAAVQLDVLPNQR